MSINYKAIKAAESAHRKQFKAVADRISTLPISEENKVAAMESINKDYQSSLTAIIRDIVDPKPQAPVIEMPTAVADNAEPLPQRSAEPVTDVEKEVPPNLF